MFNFKIQKDNRGLSLIELVVAIAILSIITATVGGAMSVATTSYRRGTVEASLQQEAQFTANAIESLIVDVTKKVSFDGTTMTIENEDVTYEIKLVGDELRYWETHADGSEGASNELLAAHVSSFNVEGTDKFEETRNVLLNIQMKNDSSTYTTAYNVTSRNNPSSGRSAEASANINCAPVIVLEPNQTYDLDYTLSGSAVTLTAEMEDDNAPQATGYHVTATVGTGVITLVADNALTGGDDQNLQLHIHSNEIKSDGTNVADKVVQVRVRRVTGLTINELSIDTSHSDGSPTKAGAVYTLSIPKANFGGIYLEKIASPSDVDYVDPYHLEWQVCEPDASRTNCLGSSNVQLLGSWADQHSEVVQFKLLADVPVGDWHAVQAVALHSDGAVLSGTHTNKTDSAYDTRVIEPYDIRVTDDSEADILRGKTAYLYPIGGGQNATTPGLTVMQFLKQYVDANTTAFNQSFEFYYRFRTTDNVDKSTGYDSGVWVKGDEAGLHGEAATTDNLYVKFRPQDFDSVYFMKTYQIQVVFAIKYQTSDGTWHTYPAEADGMPSQITFHSSENLSDVPGGNTFTIEPMKLVFDSIYTEGQAAWDETQYGYWDPNRGDWGEWVNEIRTIHHDAVPGSSIDLNGYWNENKDGIGSETHLIEISKSATNSGKVKMKIDLRAAYAKNGTGTIALQTLFDNNNNVKIYDLDNGNSIVNTSNWIPDYSEVGADDSADNRNYPILTVPSLNNLTVGHRYKLVLNPFTSPKGTEYYQDASTGRGEIYFMLVN